MSYDQYLMSYDQYLMSYDQYLMSYDQYFSKIHDENKDTNKESCR